jgi:hypothetical protein
MQEKINEQVYRKAAKAYKYNMTGNWRTDIKSLRELILEKRHFGFYGKCPAIITLDPSLDKNMMNTYATITAGFNHHGYTEIENFEIGALINLSELSISRHIRILADLNLLKIIPKKTFRDPETNQKINIPRKLWDFHTYKRETSAPKTIQEEHTSENVRVKAWQ